MQAEVAARVVDLVKIYRTETAKVHALQGVSAEFPAGAVTAVVGPSGSGKSSMLRLLAGVDRPTSGVVEVGGRDLAKLRGKELRKIRRGVVGYVFQRPSDNFVSYLTVWEHMQLAERSRTHGSSLTSDELLERLGIEHRRDHLPHELSGGEQQRAAFAQVLAAGPTLVVADEPTAELDTESGENLLEVVRALTETGIGFVLATHDHKVATLAHQTLEIDHGLLKEEPTGETTRMRRDPEVVALARGHALYRPQPNVAAPERGPEGPPVLQVDSITKLYQRGSELVHALEDVTLDLAPGRLLGLMGRSGSGKTTLLNVIAGWEQPDGGRLVWNLSNGNGSALAWADVAVVPQKLGLIEELTVRKNIEYPARLSGRLEELSGRIDDLLEEFGLTEMADRVPSETSVGQQQRTALARALVLSPRLLLADEPSGHQDAGWANGVFDALRRAAMDGTCCLVATHNEDVAEFLDEIYSMKDGRLVDTLTPAADAAPRV